MAITSVGQTNSAFYTDEGRDPNQAGSFLSFNPGTGEYEYVSYQEVVERSSPTTTPSVTIGDLFRQASGSLPETVGPYSSASIEGDIHKAAVGFKAAMTVKDLLQTGKMMGPVGLAYSLYEGYTDFTTGMARAEAFEQAKATDATIGDLMNAYEQKPSAWGYAKDLFGIGIAAFTAQPSLALGSGLGLGSTYSARQEADEAFERAREMATKQTAEIASFQEQYGLGPSVATQMQQQQASFQRQQQANLEAARTDEEEKEKISFAPSTALATIGDVMQSAFSPRGSSGSLASASVFGGSSGGSAAAQREAYAEATRGTSEKDFGFGRGGQGGDDRDSGGYGGFSGGSGAGGFEGDIGGGGFGGYA